jgi:hypothetical protein
LVPGAACPVLQYVDDTLLLLRGYDAQVFNYRH